MLGKWFITFRYLPFFRFGCHLIILPCVYLHLHVEELMVASEDAVNVVKLAKTIQTL